MNKLFKYIGVFLFLIVMSFVAVQPIHAVTLEATIGAQDSSNNYRVTVDSAGIFSFATTTGIKYPYERRTTNDTLTHADSGKTFILAWTADTVNMTLPQAIPGINYTFVDETGRQILIIPQSGDTIMWSDGGATVMVAGDRLISPGNTGDSVTIFSGVEGKWHVSNMRGAWLDAN